MNIIGAVLGQIIIHTHTSDLFGGGCNEEHAVFVVLRWVFDEISHSEHQNRKICGVVADAGAIELVVFLFDLKRNVEVKNRVGVGGEDDPLAALTGKCFPYYVAEFVDLDSFRARIFQPFGTVFGAFSFVSAWRGDEGHVAGKFGKFLCVRECIIVKSHRKSKASLS